MSVETGDSSEPETGPAVAVASVGPDDTGRHGTGGRARSAITLVLVVLTMIMLTATTIAVWAQATVFDSAETASIVGDALAEPDVQAALAVYVTEQVLSAVDVDARVSNALPQNLARLEPVIAAGLETAVERSVTRALADPDVTEMIVVVVERAHGRAMSLLEGDGLRGPISAVEGEVSVNLLPLIGRGLGRLQEFGLFSDLEIPELPADGDPQEQIAELEQATGRDLPDDFGQLVVYESERLAERQESLASAQRILALAKRAVWLLAALTIGLAVAAIAVATERWRAALWLGLGGVVAMVITRSAVERVVDDAPDLATKPGGRAAISAIVSSASTSLVRLAGLILAVAAVVAVLAASRRRWRRDDLTLVAAVATFAVIIAILGLNISSLLIGLVVAVAVPVVIKRAV